MSQPQVRKGGILVALASAVIYSGVSVLAKFAYRPREVRVPVQPEPSAAAQGALPPRQHHPGRDHRALELAPTVPAQLA